MWSILKILIIALLILIVLALVIPLLWLVIKEAGALFGDVLVSLGFVEENMGYIIFTFVCIALIIWMWAND